MNDFIIRLIKMKTTTVRLGKAKAKLLLFDMVTSTDAKKILKEKLDVIKKEIDIILKNKLCNIEDPSIIRRLRHMGWSQDIGIAGISKVMYDLNEGVKIIIGLVCKGIDELNITSFDDLNEHVFIILIRPINPKIVKL